MFTISWFAMFIVIALLFWLLLRDLKHTFKVSYYEEVLKNNQIEDKVKGKTLFWMLRS